MYENYMAEHTVKIEGRTSYGKSYDRLLEIVEQKDDVQKQLISYLKKDWYRGHKQAFWYDRHKAALDVYDGYWSFESGAVVKMLGIDDSELKDVPYYPYDLVHYKK